MAIVTHTKQQETPKPRIPRATDILKIVLTKTPDFALRILNLSGTIRREGKASTNTTELSSSLGTHKFGSVDNT